MKTKIELPVDSLEEQKETVDKLLRAAKSLDDTDKQGVIEIDGEGGYVISIVQFPPPSIGGSHFVLFRGSEKIYMSIDVVREALGLIYPQENFTNVHLDDYVHTFFDREGIRNKLLWIYRVVDRNNKNVQLLNNRVKKQVLDPAVIAAAIRG